MAFVERILSEDEELLQSQKLHWIYPLTGLLAMVAFSLAGIMITLGANIYSHGHMPQNISDIQFPVFSVATYLPALLFAAAGAVLFLIYVLKYLSTEISITTKRIIIKKGLIFVDVFEMDFEEIKGEDIDYGYFGYLFNYGSLRLDCRFIKDISVPAIGDPAKFTRILNRARAEQISNVEKLL